MKWVSIVLVLFGFADLWAGNIAVYNHTSYNIEFGCVLGSLTHHTSITSYGTRVSLSAGQNSTLGYTGDPGNYPVSVGVATNSQVTVVQYWDYSAYQDGVEIHYYGPSSPAVYYASGCVTNRTSYTARFYFLTSNDYSRESPPVPPGDYWCVNYTNSAPFQWWVSRILYDSDGGTNLITTSPPAWGNTNNPPGTPTGIDDTSSDKDPNPGVDGETGYGNTNGLTGSQYARGVSNIIDAIYGAQQQNNQGFAVLGGKMSLLSTNNSPGTNDFSGLVPWLGAISNRTDRTTNELGKIGGALNYLTNLVGNAISNAQGSNYWAVAVSNSLSISNMMVGVGQTNLYTSAQISTNVATAVASSSLWDIPVKTNCAWGPLPLMNFNPQNMKMVRTVVPWLRLITMFLIVWGCWGYMYEKIAASSLGLYHIPGGGPGSGNTVVGAWWALTWDPVILASALAIFPILLAAGLQTISSLFGGVIISPLAESGIALLSGAFGDYTAHARAALDLLFFFVPVGFIFSVFVYMVAFELLVFGATHFASYMIKMLHN